MCRPPGLARRFAKHPSIVGREPAEVEETPADRHRPDRVLAIGPEEVVPGRVEPQGVPVCPERRSIEVLETKLERAQRCPELSGTAGEGQIPSEALANHLFRLTGEREAARIPSDGTRSRRTKERLDDCVLGFRFRLALEAGHAGPLVIRREQCAKCSVKPPPNSRVRQAEPVPRRENP